MTLNPDPVSTERDAWIRKGWKHREDAVYAAVTASLMGTLQRLSQMGSMNRLADAKPFEQLSDELLSYGGLRFRIQTSVDPHDAQALVARIVLASHTGRRPLAEGKPVPLHPGCAYRRLQVSVEADLEKHLHLLTGQAVLAVDKQYNLLANDLKKSLLKGLNAIAEPFYSVLRQSLGETAAVYLFVVTRHCGLYLLDDPAMDKLLKSSEALPDRLGLSSARMLHSMARSLFHENVTVQSKELQHAGDSRDYRVQDLPCSDTAIRIPQELLFPDGMTITTLCGLDDGSIWLSAVHPTPADEFTRFQLDYALETSRVPLGGCLKQHASTLDRETQRLVAGGSAADTPLTPSDTVEMYTPNDAQRAMLTALVGKSLPYEIWFASLKGQVTKSTFDRSRKKLAGLGLVRKTSAGQYRTPLKAAPLKDHPIPIR